MEEYTNISLYQIYLTLTFFLSNLDTSYIGAVPKPAGTGRNRCVMERDIYRKKYVELQVKLIEK